MTSAPKSLSQKLCRGSVCPEVYSESNVASILEATRITTPSGNIQREILDDERNPHTAHVDEAE